MDLRAVAHTGAFDSAVSSSTGDRWVRSTSPSAAYTPLSLGPGATAKLGLTFTPNRPPGTVVRGSIHVDTFDIATFSGDEVASIPYAYTVGTG